MTGPTPGPWRYDERTETVVAAEDNVIGRFEPASGPLAAAAPELLAALERCKGALEVLRPTRNLGAVEQAGEAIAKARGERP